MNRQGKKQTLLAAWLLICLLLLCGCVDQLSERPLEDLSQSRIVTSASAPLTDRVDAQEMPVTLYFLAENSNQLYPVVRHITLENGASRAQGAVSALLQGPKDGETGAVIECE